MEGQPAAQPHACGWCGAASDPRLPNCAACGARTDVRAAVTRSGWYELPPIPDMARLQFGQSFCQVEGAYVPVADFNLAAGDSVYFTHHVLLWKDPQVDIRAMSLRGAWKRLFAGLPLVMTEAHGPGHIAFSRDEPGEMVALPLHAGYAVDVREGVFMAASGQVTYDWFNPDIWYRTRSGNETETHYPLGALMDRFAAPQAPGLLLLHGAGNVFLRRLDVNETILIKPTALLYKDAGVRMQLHIEKPRTAWSFWSSWTQRYIWLRLWGPGRVAVQSAFPHMHDDGNTFDSGSYGTTVYEW